MTNLLPNNEDAKRLAGKTYLLSEFLETMMDEYEPPQLKRKALVHGHCHQKAIIGMTHDRNILSKLGLDYELLDSGCCGMAGSFGFEDGHYDVSQKIGELVLLPAVRRASEDTLIIADGFSCREQIRQATNREVLHTAQVLQLALEQRTNRSMDGAERNPEIPDSATASFGLPGYPERILVERGEREHAKAKQKAAWRTAVAALLLIILWSQNRKRFL
jgi:hypothetical protein